MTGYGQFCAVARAHEVIGGRWTLLVVRELLCGSRRFNDIRRGIPRISKAVLSQRLQELLLVGAIERLDGQSGPEYSLTKAGEELAELVRALGTWGQRWLPRRPSEEDIDPEPLLFDMLRRVRPDALPKTPLMVRIELRGHQTRFILLKPGETAICTHNPGFPEPLVIRARLAELVAWWRGDKSFVEARRDGLVIIGPRHLIQAFPGWFERYMFAAVAQVRGCVKTDRVAGGERGDAGGRAGHSFPLSRAKWRSTG
jgi:DNA-binding HxlR family transcriptional regulator